MKLQKTKVGNEVKISFLPETEEEKRIMGALRDHYFFGLPEENTYPEYDGIRTEDNFVVEMRFKYQLFNQD